MSVFELGWHLQHTVGGSLGTNRVHLVLQNEEHLIKHLPQRSLCIYRHMLGDTRGDPIAATDTALDHLREARSARPDLKFAHVVTNEPIQEWYDAQPSREAYQQIGEYQRRALERLDNLAPEDRRLLCVDQGWFQGDGPDVRQFGYYGFQFYEAAAQLATGFVVHGYWNAVPPDRGQWWTDTPLELRVPSGRWKGQDTHTDYGYWSALRMFRPPKYKDIAENVDAGDPGGIYHTLCARYPHKPIYITETNGGGGDDHTGNDYRASRKIAEDAEYYAREILRLDTRGQVRALLWFIEGTNDPRHNVFRPNDHVRTLFNSFRVERAPQPQPDPIPEPPKEPDMTVAHTIWDRVFKTAGAEGYNPNAATHANLPAGAIPMGPEFDADRFRVLPCTTGAAVYDRQSNRYLGYARSRAELDAVLGKA